MTSSVLHVSNLLVFRLLRANMHIYIYIMHDGHVYMKDKLNTSMLYVPRVSNDSSNPWTRASRTGSHIFKLLQEKYVEDNLPSPCAQTIYIHIYVRVRNSWRIVPKLHSRTEIEMYLYSLCTI